jgi:hypothetical protein
MSASHTPGPWYLIENKRSGIIWAGDANDPTYVAATFTAENAHAIVMVPELLEALSECIRAFLDAPSEFRIGHMRLIHKLARIDAAARAAKDKL